MVPATKIFLGLGSNVGDSSNTLQACVDILAEALDDIRVSSIYLTKPRDFEDQEDFLNCVVSAQSTMNPRDLLAFTSGVENRLGRVRSFKNAPRTIDIDILLYGSMILDDPLLTLPHPRIPTRKFVLIPLLELEWDLAEPGTGISYSTYLDALDNQGIYYFNLNRYI